MYADHFADNERVNNSLALGIHYKGLYLSVSCTSCESVSSSLRMIGA